MEENEELEEELEEEISDDSEMHFTVYIEHWQCKTCGRMYPFTYKQCLNCHHKHKPKNYNKKVKWDYVDVR
jgi:hypothetical protein